MGKRRSENIVKQYLSEQVSYGGVLVSRGAMILDLRKIAVQIAPRDKAEQRRLVEVYLSGHGFRRR